MRPRSRSHLATAAIVACLAGAVTGVAAAGRIGPFQMLGFVPRPAAAPAPQPQLKADELYPAPTQPPTIHQIIEVQDPPVVVAPASSASQPPVSPPAPPTAAPTASATPNPTPVPSPSPSPCSDDGCGGDH